MGRCPNKQKRASAATQEVCFEYLWEQIQYFPINISMLEFIAGAAEKIGESESMENQREMLNRYVRQHGWNFCAAYCDDGV